MKKLFAVLLFITISLGAYSQTIQFENINNNGGSHVEADIYCYETTKIILYLNYTVEGQIGWGGYFAMADKYQLKGNQSDFQMIEVELAPGVHKFEITIYEHTYSGRAYGSLYISSTSVGSVGPNNEIRAEFRNSY